MGLTSEQKRMVVILLAGTLIAVLNQTLLSPALPVIMADLEVNATTVQWLTSGYSLVEAIVIPLSAYLMGRFSTRRLFIGGMCIFATGTVLGAVAPVFFVLLLGRMMQAAATGFVMPMVFSIIVLTFPREHRGSAMGLVSLVIGFAPAVGPSVSGVLVETVGWRAVFVTVAALALCVIIAASFNLKNLDVFERTTFDKVSVVLSCLGLLSLLYGLSSITSSDMPVIQICLIVVGAVLMALFVKRQTKLPVPFLRVQVLKTRNYRVCVTMVASFQAALVGTGVLLPIFLQNLLGATPLQTGLIMLPGAVLGAVTAMLAGRFFDRVGARKLVLPGVSLALLGGVGLISYTMQTPLLFVMVVYMVLILGLEFTMTPINTWGINSLPNNVIQHANATANTINQISASLGTAILVSLSAIPALVQPDLALDVQQMNGIHLAFCFTALMMLAIFFVAFFFVKDRKTEPEKAADYVMETMPVGDTSIPVEMVMLKDPYFVYDDAEVRDAANLMVRHKTSGLPVVDRDRIVKGFISDGDIMKYIARNDHTVLDSTQMLYQVPDDEKLPQRVVALMKLPIMNIATAKAISVTATTPLDEACKLLSTRHLKKVPVVDGRNRLIGTLSRSDIVRSTMEHLAYIEKAGESDDNGGAEEIG